MRAANAERTPAAQYTTTGARLVDEAALDLGFEVPAGDVHGAGKGALVVFVGFTDVEHHGAGGDALGGVGGADLGDLGFRRRQEIAERSHHPKPTHPVGNRSPPLHRPGGTEDFHKHFRAFLHDFATKNREHRACKDSGREIVRSRTILLVEIFGPGGREGAGAGVSLDRGRGGA